MGLQYLTGDATSPVSERVIIAHGCNDMGAWGAGFVIPLGRRFPQARTEFLDAKRLRKGDVQFVSPKGTQVLIANMVTQTLGIRRPTSLFAVGKCLAIVGDRAREEGRPIQMPRICCGLGGEVWESIEPLILRNCEGVEVYVLDLPIGGN